MTSEERVHRFNHYLCDEVERLERELGEARHVARLYYYREQKGGPAFPPDLERWPWLKRDQ